MFLAVSNGTSSADKVMSVTAPGTARSVQLAGGAITVPAQAAAYLTGPEPKVVLRGLTRPLPSGPTVTVILTFQNAGALTLAVPVEPRSTYYSSYSPPAPGLSPARGAKPGATGTASPAGTSAQPSATATPTP